MVSVKKLCLLSGKQCHRDEETASRYYSGGTRFVIYPCLCGCWHVSLKGWVGGNGRLVVTEKRKQVTT
jgi:hypothetical protein